MSARDAHSRVWESVQFVTDPVTGEAIPQKHSYVELTTGMHYWDGQWIESEEKFEITPQGDAVAAKGQMQLQLAANINTGGSVEWITPAPERQRLLSNPMGLSFFDSATGKNVLIAEVKDCIGEQIAPNVILYPDALDSLKGAIRFEFTRSSFSQDLILYQNPGSPADFGLDPNTTHLVMYTEFHDPPVPQKSTNFFAGGLTAETLDFGQVQIAKGVAYFQNQQTEATRVFAQWLKLDGRDFLIEAVPYPKVQASLEKLQAAVKKEVKGEWAQRVFPTRRALLAKLESKRDKQRELAVIQPGRASTEPALTLDYTTLLTQSGVTLRGDETYLVTNAVNLSGENFLESAVLKFDESSSARINISGQLHCKTSPYRPAIFTSKLDNTVGVKLVDSGTPSISHGGLAFSSSGATLSNVRFAYAATAVSLGFSPGQINLANAQFINCQYAIDSSLEDQNTIVVDNALFNAVTYGIKGGRDLIVRGQHLTVDRCDQFAHSQTGGDGFAYLTNCLLVAVTNWGSDFTFTTNNTSYYSTDPGGVFQTVGGGAHYLTDAYRLAGTTNISAALASELKTRTTHPPVGLSSLTTNTMLTPKAPRDSTTYWRGYHYAPLDYFACGVGVASNVTVTVTNGVAIGTDYSTNTWGFILKNAKFLSTGDALNYNYIVRAHTGRRNRAAIRTRAPASTTVTAATAVATLKCGCASRGSTSCPTTVTCSTSARNSARWNGRIAASITRRWSSARPAAARSPSA